MFFECFSEELTLAGTVMAVHPIRLYYSLKMEIRIVEIRGVNCWKRHTVGMSNMVAVYQQKAGPAENHEHLNPSYYASGTPHEDEVPHARVR